jgi:3D (Asp-Asp-Asp) domain-containing protein
VPRHARIPEGYPPRRGTAGRRLPDDGRLWQPLVAVAISDHKPRRYVLETTGYCPCQECCSWHRNWLFIPVTSDGHIKKVSYTASGNQARPGTIAADTTIFPFGTIMFVPGYGYGRVEDRGGDIAGPDL